MITTTYIVDCHGNEKKHTDEINGAKYATQKFVQLYHTLQSTEVFSKNWFKRILVPHPKHLTSNHRRNGFFFKQLYQDERAWVGVYESSVFKYYVEYFTVNWYL